MDILEPNKKNLIKETKKEEKKEKEEKSNFSNKETIKKDPIKANSEEKKNKKTKNKNINENENNNGTQKNDFSKINFIVDYNSYSKCSCYKIQCNKKYCECLKSNRYCISCYYQNCKNRPPINSTNNIKINHHLKKENEKKKSFLYLFKK